jgi:pimeloyl-ACP methyl ester carboxylesterase
VGTGQVVDMERGESLSYFGAIDRLRAKGNERGAAALEAVGPPPYRQMKGLMKQRRLLISTMPKAERRTLRSLVSALLLGADSRLKDMPDYFAGMRFSLEALWTPLQAWKLADGGLVFDVPLVFIEGDLDLQVPSALVTELKPKLRAPKVELVTIFGGAHAALMTHPGEFRRVLVETVRPLAMGKGRKKAKA